MYNKIKATGLLVFLTLPHAQLLAQSSSINLFGGSNSASSFPSKSSMPSSPSSPKSPSEPSALGSSVSKVERSGEEPAVKIGMKYIQHQKMIETQSQAKEVASKDPPNLLLPPSSQTSQRVTPSGPISLSQALFEGYISFLKMGRQFGAIDVEMPMRQLKSDYSERVSGSEFGGISLMLVAGERGVGSFGVGGQHLQSPTLGLIQKHQLLVGHFYLERGTQSASKSRSRFFMQLGPEISLPMQQEDDQAGAIKYAPIYGGKALISFATPFAFSSPLRMKAFGQIFRTNQFTQNKISQAGGGLLVAGASLDYNVSGDLWLGVEGNWAIAKPKSREYIFGNPELPALYGNSVSAFIQAAAF